MTENSIKLAVASAERFLRCAKVVLKENVRESTWEGKVTRRLDAGKNTGALRRASMDATRALAEMRNGK
jgi:hypothetical protein